MPECQLVVDTRAGLAEGPVWWQDRLLWVDVEVGELHRYDPSTGTDTTLLRADVISAVAPTLSGSLLLARPGGLELVGDTGTTEVWRAPHDTRTTRLNDMACDPVGRAVVGSMAWNERDPVGALHIVGRSAATTVSTGLVVSNGIGWTPDGRWMYHTDSPRRTVDRYRYDADDGVAEFVDAFPIERPGVCDGLAVDVDGCVWAANWGGWSVRRYTPDGRLDRTIPIPASQVTSCCFGGPGLETLYVTTARRGRSEDKLRSEPDAGGVFAVDVGVGGLLTVPFDDVS